jgi:hypothetical protein
LREIVLGMRFWYNLLKRTMRDPSFNLSTAYPL